MKLMPVMLALLGLAAGVGAGLVLKPAPEAEASAPECHEGEDCPAPDPLAAPDPHAAAEPAHEPSVVAVEKPFVVPIFKGEKVAAMVVASVAIEVQAEHETSVEEVTPRLRDALLAAMFRHANTGGFDGAFTAGRKMEDLRAALLAAARQVFGETPVSDVLITEIARQDV